MLGHHPLLERRLRKHGRRAGAVVLESERTRWAETHGSDAVVGDTDILWKLRMRVEPEGEPPFEARVETMLPQTWAPGPGANFPVLFDPDDHEKVVVDHSDEGEHRLAQALDKERTDDRVSRMRASGAGEMADRYAAIHDPALGLFDDSTLSKNWDERKRQLAERRAKIKEIMAGAGGPAAAPTVRLGATPGPAETADALTKLADLRDRGVLSPEEFDAQKQRLLSQ